jgi:hypothetical protein
VKGFEDELQSKKIDWLIEHELYDVRVIDSTNIGRISLNKLWKDRVLKKRVMVSARDKRESTHLEVVTW